MLIRYAEARQRIMDAHRAHTAALDARVRNRTPETAASVAIARQHVEDAQRALDRLDLH